jgi:hypothetical protein
MSAKPWKSVLKKELQEQCRAQDLEYQESDDKAVLWTKLHREEMKMCEKTKFSKLRLEERTASPTLSQLAQTEANIQQIKTPTFEPTVPTPESTNTPESAHAPFHCSFCLNEIVVGGLKHCSKSKCQKKKLLLSRMSIGRSAGWSSSIFLRSRPCLWARRCALENHRYPRKRKGHSRFM